MKKIIVCLIFICSSAMAVEYGIFSRTQIGTSFDKSITLQEGDRLVIENMQDYPSLLSQNQVIYGLVMDCQYHDISFSRTVNMILKNISTNHDYAHYEILPENLRTIIGPCIVTPSSDNGYYVIEYKIIRAAESAAPSDSKYTASLNADGTRLAIGEQQGTNTSARVYEFNDDNETWEQLGDSVE